jgi:hypothetical protein
MQISSIIITVVLAALTVLLLLAGFRFLKPGKSGQAESGRSAPPDSEEIPDWLIQALRQFENKSFAYALYRISLYEELSEPLKQRFDRLEEKIYSPPVLLLFEARKKAGCTDRQLDKFLEIYIRQKTGSGPEPGRNLISCTQELILNEAIKTAQQIQQGKIPV